MLTKSYNHKFQTLFKVSVQLILCIFLSTFFVSKVQAQSCGSSCGCNGVSCSLGSAGNCSWDPNLLRCRGSFAVDCNSGSSCNGGAYGQDNNNAYCSSSGTVEAGCSLDCCGIQLVLPNTGGSSSPTPTPTGSASPTPSPTIDPAGCIPCPNEPWKQCCQALSFECPNGCDTTTNNHNDGIYRCYENQGTSTTITGCGQVDWLDANGQFAGYTTWNCGPGCQGQPAPTNGSTPTPSPAGCKSACNLTPGGSPSCAAASAGNRWTSYLCYPTSPTSTTGECLNRACITSVDCVCPPTPAPTPTCAPAALSADRISKCTQAPNAPRICGSNYIVDCQGNNYNCGEMLCDLDTNDNKYKCLGQECSFKNGSNQYVCNQIQCYNGGGACTTVNNGLCCDPTNAADQACLSGVPAYQRRQTTTSYCPFDQANVYVACSTNISGTLYDVTEFDIAGINVCNLVATSSALLDGYKITNSTPYGTISLVSTNVSSPATFSNSVNSDGTYTVSGVRVPDTYSLLPTLPVGLSFASEPRCTQSTVSFGVGENQVARTNVNFGFWRGIPGWFQLIGGNILTEETASANAIKSSVPERYAGASYAPRIFMRKSGAADATAGFAVTGQGAATIVSARKSDQSNTYLRDVSDSALRKSTQRTRSATKVFKQNYAYFYRRYSLGNITNGQFPNSVIPLDDSDSFSQGVLNALGTPERGAFYATGYQNAPVNAVLSGTWNVQSNQSYVIFVNGNITINSPIIVHPGGYLAIITNGNITFSPTIGTATHSSETPTVEGVFIADKKIIIDTADAVNHGDLKFIGAGTFVGWEGFTLARDLRTNSTLLENYDWPAELFIERPDFALNAPAKMKKPLYDWNEVAP